MNEINLNAFQFEFDLTWMAFFRNANGQTYARYGGREDSGPETHLTKKSLLLTMNRVLKLHDDAKVKPWSRYEPKPKSRFTPEQFAPMAKMIAKREEKCIHCHDVKNAMLHDLRTLGNLKKDNVFTYPSPRQLGILLDANDQTKVKQVIERSAADMSGVKRGDVISTVDKQPVLTFADFTRVLELQPAQGRLTMRVNRNGAEQKIVMPLATNWRRSEDPSWRPSTSVVGPNSGFWGKPLGPGDLKKRKLDKKDLALKVVVVWGQWAKKAGIRNGDVVVEIDGLRKSMSIRQLQTHLQMQREFGDTVKLTVLRGGRERELEMQLPEKAQLE